MSYEQYVADLKELLAITHKIKDVAVEKNFDGLEECFKKHSKIFEKLALPNEDLSQEQVDVIMKLKDEIFAVNNEATKILQDNQDEIRKALSEVSVEQKLLNAYKAPRGEVKSSFHDSKE